MSMPTRDQLNAEVDRRYFEQYPDAPVQLDPDDPDHASWIDAWLEIRDEVLNDWVNRIFARFFPNAGKLDPEDSTDESLIEYWLDLRDQLRDGVAGTYNWDDDPAGPPAQLAPRSVEHDPNGGWVVTFNSELSVEEATRYLWTGSKPDGVVITARSVNAIHLSGLSIEAVESMTPEVGTQIQPSVLTAD